MKEFQRRGEEEANKAGRALNLFLSYCETPGCMFKGTVSIGQIGHQRFVKSNNIFSTIGVEIFLVFFVGFFNVVHSLQY